jgi:putative transposase
MDESQSLSHTVWESKHHVVWIPECRRKVLYTVLRNHWQISSREFGKWVEIE